MPVVPVGPIDLSEAQAATAVLIVEASYQLWQRNARRVISAQPVLAWLADACMRSNWTDENKG